MCALNDSIECERRVLLLVVQSWGHAWAQLYLDCLMLSPNLIPGGICHRAPPIIGKHGIPPSGRGARRWEQGKTLEGAALRRVGANHLTHCKLSGA